MVVEITCPSCECTLPMLAPPGGARFACPECGAAIHTSERLSVAPPAVGVEIRPGEGRVFATVEAEHQEPPSVAELVETTARSLPPPVPPRPLAPARPENLAPRTPLYSLEPATMELDIAPELLQPPAWSAPVRRDPRRLGRYAMTFTGAASLAILALAGVRAHERTTSIETQPIAVTTPSPASPSVPAEEPRVVAEEAKAPPPPPSGDCAPS